MSEVEIVYEKSENVNRDNVLNIQDKTKIFLFYLFIFIGFLVVYIVPFIYFVRLDKNDIEHNCEPTKNWKRLESCTFSNRTTKLIEDDKIMVNYSILCIGSVYPYNVSQYCHEESDFCRYIIQDNQVLKYVWETNS